MFGYRNWLFGISITKHLVIEGLLSWVLSLLPYVVGSVSRLVPRGGDPNTSLFSNFLILFYTLYILLSIILFSNHIYTLIYFLHLPVLFIIWKYLSDFILFK